MKPITYDLREIEAYLAPNWNGLMTGVFDVAIDRRGRVTMPAGMRRTLTTSGITELGIYVNADHIELMPICGRTSRPKWLVALIDGSNLATVGIVRLLRNGALTVPKYLREEAGLGRKALVMGTGHRIEIWAPARYEGKRARRSECEVRIPCATHLFVTSPL